MQAGEEEIEGDKKEITEEDEEQEFKEGKRRIREEDEDWGEANKVAAFYFLSVRKPEPEGVQRGKDCKWT
jgi:hypothetical protein